MREIKTLYIHDKLLIVKLFQGSPLQFNNQKIVKFNNSKLDEI